MINNVYSGEKSRPSLSRSTASRLKRHWSFALGSIKSLTSMRDAEVWVGSPVGLVDSCSVEVVVVKEEKVEAVGTLGLSCLALCACS